MRILGVTASSYELYTAFESIASSALGSDTASVTFSSIPNTYQHLQLRMLVKNDSTTSNVRPVYLRFNSDSGSNYVYHNLVGNGSSASSGNWTGYSYVELGLTTASSTGLSNNFGVFLVDIHDYASTSKNQTVRTFSGTEQNGSGYSQLYSGLWLNTNAINSITLLCAGTQKFVTGSTFALYGIKGA